jgi:hypothetical protein
LLAAAGAGFTQEQPAWKDNLRLADSAMVQIIKTTDGSSNLGRIVAIDSAGILFQTEVASFAIPLDKIAGIKEVPLKSIVRGEHWFSNPNATRLFFGPTAHMLKKGEGYLSDTYLFFPQIVFGFTDNLTLGGGLSLLPGGGLKNQLVYLMPKAGGPVGRDLHLAAGALVIRLPEFDDGKNTTVGVLYAVGTRGNRDRSFSAGLGYGFEGERLADRPMVMAGGEYRVSRRVSLVTENWVFPGLDQPLVAAGFRFFGEGLAVDLALANVLGKDMLMPGVPFVDFVYNF